jgi:hypothetical protein
MTRYVKSGTVNTVQEINSELEKIATAQEGFLSLAGETPNEMLSNLDMNSNHILNLPTPTNPYDPVRKRDLPSFAYVDGVVSFTKDEETQTLASAQTTVTFSSITTDGCDFYISGLNVDAGRLLDGVDFNITNSTTIELEESYPADSKVTLVKVEGVVP